MKASLKENPLRYSLTTRFKDRHFIDLLSPLQGKRILDVGCGIGYLSELLASHGAEVVGMDVEYSAVAHSKTTVDGSFALASALQLPFRDDSFDGIVMADVIEHLPYPKTALDEVRRIGKIDAPVLISTPNLKGWLTGTWVLSMLHGENDGHMADHTEGYTAESLSEVMRSASIEPNAVRVTNPLISQLFLSLVKLGYRSVKSTYSTQTELVSLNNNWKFQLYKQTLFPLAYGLGRLEETLFHNFIEGHCLILSGTIRQ